MPEIEVPTEHLHEHIHHQAHSNGGWVNKVALTAALLAVLAAITALLAGHYANEAMIEQIQASNQWAYFQAKSIKSSVVESRVNLMQEMGKEPYAKDLSKIEEYKKEQTEISEIARDKEVHSATHLKMHNTLAKGVTIFQISIAICAIAAIASRKWLWYASIFLGAIGSGFLILAFL